MIRVTLISAFALILAGCSAAPKLTVTDIKVADRSEAGIVLSVSIDAENRNEIEVPLREIRYSVRVEGGSSFSGVRFAEASLRRLGTQTLWFPAVIPIAPGTAPPSGLVNVEVSGKMTYFPPGDFSRVLYETGIRRPSQSFKGAAAVQLGP